MPNQVWVQEWEESERGWGVRSDGYQVWSTKDRAVTGAAKYLKEMRDKEFEYSNGDIPEVYSRSVGNPIAVEVSFSKLVHVTNNEGMWIRSPKELEEKK